MISLLLVITLSQTVQPVKIVNPENQSQGLGNANPLKVNCVSGCSPPTGDQSVYVLDSGVLNVNPIAGASTSALQSTGNTSLSSIDGKTPALVSGRVPVDGSGVTQPVSGPLTDVQLRATPVPVSGTVTTSPPSNASTNITQVNSQTVNVGTGTAGTGTQRVAVASDSSLTCNAGTNLNTSSLALSATQTDKSQFTRITDGTRDGTLKAGSTAAQAADTSLVVALSPNSALPSGTNVIGHVVHDTGSTTAVTGNVTVVQPTGTNLHAVLDTTSTTAVTQATGTNLHAVIDTGSTTAVTGNVTVIQGTGTNLHVVSDATSTTTATQATGTNLHVVTDSTSTTAVSTTAVAAATTPAQCTTVGIASTTVLAAQAGRKKWSVKASPANTVNCFFRMGATALVTDMPLEPTAAFTDDGTSVYTGVVDAICAGAAQTICALSL